MSKELEKELMNDVMDNDELQVEPNDIAMLLYDIYDVPSGMCKQIKDMIQRLESIDNASPSEALKELKELHELAYGNEETSWKIDEIRMSSHIKQALLKAQEQEKVLEVIKELISKHCKIELIDGGTYYQIKIKVMGSDYTFGMSITKEEFDLLKKHFLKEVK